MLAASLRCLVLNASMEPISVVSAQRGLVLLLKERAMMLERAQVWLPLDDGPIRPGPGVSSIVKALLYASWLPKVLA